MRRGFGSAGLALVGLAVAGLTACGGNDNGGAVRQLTPAHGPTGAPGALRAKVPAAIASAGALRVAVSVGRPPMLFFATGTKQLEGVEYDLMQAVGREFGLPVQMVETSPDQLGLSLGSRADVFISGVADLKSLQAAGIDFVDYAAGSSATLVRRGDPTQVKSPAGVCGKRVGVVVGTAQQVVLATLTRDCTSRGRPAPTVEAGRDHAALLASLLAGQLDTIVDDAVVAQYTAEGSTGAATVEVAGPVVDPLPYGIGVAKGDAALRDGVQAALSAMLNDGSYGSALSHWGADADALHAITVNTGP